MFFIAKDAKMNDRMLKYTYRMSASHEDSIERWLGVLRFGGLLPAPGLSHLPGGLVSLYMQSVGHRESPVPRATVLENDGTRQSRGAPLFFLPIFSVRDRSKKASICSRLVQKARHARPLCFTGAWPPSWPLGSSGFGLIECTRFFRTLFIFLVSRLLEIALVLVDLFQLFVWFALEHWDFSLLLKTL